MRVLIVFGTRPEAIKLAPVIESLRRDPAFEVVTCITAQHRQMLDQVLDWFRIAPDFDLNLMQPNQSLAQLSARALEALDGVIAAAQPDIVLVQGDTTTAMIAALAAFYARVAVGHVEAGLRTYDLDNPFPEEANRRMISVIAAHHFAPTAAARDALVREGVPANRVHLTGNTVIDALKWTLAQPHPLALDLPLDLPGERLMLVTAHRRESFGAELEHICLALRQLVAANPNVRIVYPVHLNPNVQETVYRLLGGCDRIHLIAPLAYPDFVHLLARAYLVLTDSGGLQEEAPALGKPVLVLRRTTERPEAVAAGVAQLAGTNTASIVAAAQTLLDDPAAYARMANAVSPFGDGTAADQIAAVLRRASSPRH